MNWSWLLTLHYEERTAVRSCCSHWSDTLYSHPVMARNTMGYKHCKYYWYMFQLQVVCFFFSPRSAMALFASPFSFLYQNNWEHLVTCSKNFLYLPLTQQFFPSRGIVWEEGGSCSQYSTCGTFVMLPQRKMIHTWMFLINESKRC